jgi:hypothetical protein
VKNPAVGRTYLRFSPGIRPAEPTAVLMVANYPRGSRYTPIPFLRKWFTTLSIMLSGTGKNSPPSGSRTG